MKVILSILFLMLVGKTMGQVPVFEWAANLQWVNAITPRSVTTDSQQNVLVTGSFTSWQDFDPGPAQLLIQSAGGGDVFIMKLNSAGQLVWVKTLGSVDPQIGLCIAVDSSDNIYVNGTFNSTGDLVDMDPGPGTFTLGTSTYTSGFLVSLSPSGNFRWARTLPGFMSDYTSSQLCYSPDGGILITEKFTGTMDFDSGPGTFNMTASGSSSYLMKLDLDGNFLWSKAFTNGVDRTRAIDVNTAGDIFITGYFNGSPDFDPGPATFNLTSNGPFSDAFVLKLNGNGDFVWASAFGGTAFDKTTDIAADNNGNVYVSGTYEGVSDLDPGPSVFSVTALGNEDNFVLKLNPSGNFSWALPFPVTAYFEEPTLETDTAGNLYIAATFRDTLDIIPGSGIHEIMASPSSQFPSNPDVFIAKLSTQAELVWVRQFGGEVADKAYGVHVSPTNDVHVIGIYDETVDFNPGYGNAVYTSTGSYDAFNLKYTQCPQTTPTPDLAVLPNITSSCVVDTLIPPTASEFCLGTITGVANVTFPLSAQDTTTVTWTYDAGNGNISTQIQMVIISDTVAPVPGTAQLPDITDDCSVESLTNPTASDNCSATVTISNNAQLPILSNTTITWTFDDGNGNTAVQTQEVIISGIDNGINQINEVTLTASATGYTYQWVDCTNGNTPVNGATSQTFTATENGSYAVEITNGVCTVLSDCIAISEVGLTEVSDGIGAIITPNPSADGIFTLTLPNSQSGVTITVLNGLGQVVDYSLESTETGHKIHLFATNGVYLLRITSAQHTVSYRVIKG